MEEAIPFDVLEGMVVTASFVDESDENGYVWMRRFEDEEHASEPTPPSTGATNGTTTILPTVNRWLIQEQIVVTRLAPTTGSPVR